MPSRLEITKLGNCVTIQKIVSDGVTTYIAPSVLINLIYREVFPSNWTEILGSEMLQLPPDVLKVVNAGLISVDHEIDAM